MTILIQAKKPVKSVLRRLGLFDSMVRLLPLLQVRSRVRERRLRARSAAAGLPIPPSDLLFLVAGTTDVSWFLSGGKAGFQAIEQVLDRHGVPAANLNRVLDFGCGCGRVLRHWHPYQNVEVHGTDYNPDLITWCQRNLGFANFAVNGLEPPLLYADSQFDLIYALSVFTHLTEPLHRAWIDELRRIIRTGGFLLITTHGRTYRERLNSEEQLAYDSGELVVKKGTSAGSNTCAAFHPEEYVRKLVQGKFEIVDFIPEGAKGNPRQDLFLLRKI
jgi:SAM-dependent methyltransferase